MIYDSSTIYLYLPSTCTMPIGNCMQDKPLILVNIFIFIVYVLGIFPLSMTGSVTCP